jgi:hypothetical protein
MIFSGQCEGPAQYLEFKEWMAKEWAVYCAEIKWMQAEVELCFQKHGVEANRDKYCSSTIKQYMEAVEDNNLNEARKKLWRGEKLVE